MPDTTQPRIAPSPAKALRQLAEKGARAQWSTADIGAWENEIGLPRWLPRSFAAAVVSQFYHGEQATLTMCRRLLDEIEEPAARRCIEIQIVDEERHAEVYETYVTRIGHLHPIDPGLSAAYAGALAWDGPPQGLIAAFNIVLEGEALFALDYLGGWLPCPLFRRINARIARDEARHMAFGRLYLKATVGALDRDRRLEIVRWLEGLWSGTARGILDRFAIPNGVIRRRCRTWVDTGWHDHRRALAAVGLPGTGGTP